MVRVVLPGPLRSFNGGDATLVVEGTEPATVGALLDELRRRHASVYACICTERHQVRPHVNIFVGTDDIRWVGGLEAPIPSGSEVVILPSVSGG